MAEALLEAKKAFDKNEVPVGAIIVENNQIIARAHNQNIELCDPSAHAEILALRLAAASKNSSRLENCDIYITLEPCFMCVSAISLAKIRRIYYAASDEKFGAIEHGKNIFNQNFAYHKPEIYSGFYETESRELLQNFFKNLRQNK